MSRDAQAQPIPDLSAFRALAPVTTFGACVDRNQYRPVAADWSIIITDVRGSTAAIEAGRYREVNQVGAMGVAALKNALGGLDFPFVFGGDGATFVLPPAETATALPILQGVKAVALEQFGLELRVGSLPLQSIQSGSPPSPSLAVARYQLTEGLSTTLFSGGALAAAEAQIKGDPTRCLAAGDPTAADLRGLTCRWEPIPTGRGVTLSLLVDAADAETYTEVLALVTARCPGLETPVVPERMVFSEPAVNLARDQRFSRFAPPSVKVLRLAELGFFTAAVRWGQGLVPAIGQQVREANRTHSDHKKFDEMLRMVLDCSPEDMQAIDAGLQSMRAQGRLVYGMHAANHALMTCLVDHLGQGGHVHFVDGGDGGYALAAKQLKAMKHALYSQR